MELKERIIQEASSLFFKHGIRSITMSDIANHMGISKRTLYEVFKDKEELLEESINAHIRCADKEMEKITSGSENVIDTMLRIYAKHLNDVHSINKSLVYDLKKYHPRLYEKIRDKQGDEVNIFIPLFSRGVEQGLIREDIDIEICLWLIKSQFQSLMEGSHLPTEKFSMNQFVRAIILNFTRGVATPKGNELIDELVEKINRTENNSI